MAKSEGRVPPVPVLPTSPMSLACPLCEAKPAQNCFTGGGGDLAVVHVARVKAAAAQDVASKK